MENYTHSCCYLPLVAKGKQQLPVGHLSAVIVRYMRMQAPSVQFGHVFLNLLNLYKYITLRLITK
jgi:hypothetical protein